MTWQTIKELVIYPYYFGCSVPPTLLIYSTSDATNLLYFRHFPVRDVDRIPSWVYSHGRNKSLPTYLSGTGTPTSDVVDLRHRFVVCVPSPDQLCLVLYIIRWKCSSFNTRRDEETEGRWVGTSPVEISHETSHVCGSLGGNWRTQP